VARPARFELTTPAFGGLTVSSTTVYGRALQFSVRRAKWILLKRRTEGDYLRGANHIGAVWGGGVTSGTALVQTLRLREFDPGRENNITRL